MEQFTHGSLLWNMQFDWGNHDGIMMVNIILMPFVNNYKFALTSLVYG